MLDFFRVHSHCSASFFATSHSMHFRWSNRVTFWCFFLLHHHLLLYLPQQKQVANAFQRRECKGIECEKQQSGSNSKHTYRSVGQIAVEYWSVSFSKQHQPTITAAKICYFRVSRNRCRFCHLLSSSLHTNNWSLTKHFSLLLLLILFSVGVFYFDFFFCVKRNKATISL